MAAIGFQSLIEGFFISYHSDCFRNGLVRLCHRFQSLIEGFFISYKVPQAKAEQAVVIADCFSPSLRDFLFLTLAQLSILFSAFKKIKVKINLLQEKHRFGCISHFRASHSAFR